jgi:hypothetical protein
MILEIQIPDEVFEKYDKSVDALITRLLDTQDLDVEPNFFRFIFSPAQIAALQRHFGPFRDAADLVNRIENVGSVKVQGADFQLNSDQIQNLKTQAYFLADHDEPASEAEAIARDWPKDKQKALVQRYLQTCLQDAMDMVLGLN